MAASVVAGGTVLASGANNTTAQTVTPALPTGTASGDRVFLFVGAAGGGTINTPASWSVAFTAADVGTGTYGAATGVRKIAVFYRDYDGAWTMPAVGSAAGPAANVGAAFAIAVRRGTGEAFGTPVTSSGNDTTSGTGYSATTASMATSTGGVVMAGSVFPTTATTASPTLTQTSATFAGLSNTNTSAGTTSGNDIAMVGYAATITTGATNTVTHALTLGTATTGGTVVVSQPSTLVAPTGVSAGIDDDHLVSTALTRTGTATGATSYAWTIQSGPAGVGSTIGTALALSWTPTTAGTYVIRLAATNGAGTTTDDATIYVEAATAVNDTFTRTSTTDPGTADTGQQWIARVGTWGPDGTKLLTRSNGDGDVATVLAGTTDQTVRATLPAPSAFGGASITVLGRWENNNTFFGAEITGDGAVTIRRVVAGAFATVTSAAAGTMAAAGVVEISMAEETTPTAGTRLIVKLDGTQILNTLDTVGSRPLNGLRAGGRKGFSGGTVSWDDFQVNYTGPTTSAAGAITLGGSVTGTAAGPSTAGAITLGGAPTASASATAAGTITLGGSTTPSVAASSAGTITLGGSATGSFTASGSITLGGTVTAQARPTAAGAITLGGAPTATAPATASGGITLSGAPTARAAATATGTITLGGSGAATQPGSSASGTITLGGAATAGVTASATGSITLGGSPTARAAATAAGTITLGGTSTASATSSAAGSITLTGAPTARAAATTSGVITLGGTGTVQVPGSTATGSITLSGAPTATAPASVTGVIVLGGAPTGRAAATTGGVIVLGGAPTVAVSASVAGAIFLSGIANGVDGAVPLPVEFDITGLVSPTLGTAAAGSPTAGVTASSPSLAVWANSPTILLTL